MTPTTWEEAAREAAETITHELGYSYHFDGTGATIETADLLATLDADVTQLAQNVQHDRYTRGNYVRIGAAGLYGYFSRHGGYETVNEVVSYVLATCCAKQHDYGHGNILKFGHQGVVVRLSDKVERLKNLHKRAGEAANESMQDSWLDVMGYAIVGFMLAADTFELPLAADLATDVHAPAVDTSVSYQQGWWEGFAAAQERYTNTAATVMPKYDTFKDQREALVDNMCPDVSGRDL